MSKHHHHPLMSQTVYTFIYSMLCPILHFVIALNDTHTIEFKATQYLRFFSDHFRSLDIICHSWNVILPLQLTLINNSKHTKYIYVVFFLCGLNICQFINCQVNNVDFLGTGFAFTFNTLLITIKMLSTWLYTRSSIYVIYDASIYVFLWLCVQFIVGRLHIKWP